MTPTSAGKYLRCFLLRAAGGGAEIPRDLCCWIPHHPALEPEKKTLEIILRILKMSCHLFSLCLRNDDAIRVAMNHTLVTLLHADIADSSRVSAAG